MGRGIPSPSGEGAVPPPRKKIDFVSQYGEFWCILDGIFLQFSYLFYTQNWYNLVPLPIFFLIFRFKKDLVHFLAFWRRQKFHAYARLRKVTAKPDSDKHVGICPHNILHSSCRRRAHIR